MGTGIAVSLYVFLQGTRAVRTLEHLRATSLRLV